MTSPLPSTPTPRQNWTGRHILAYTVPPPGTPSSHSGYHFEIPVCADNVGTWPKEMFTGDPGRHPTEQPVIYRSHRDTPGVPENPQHTEMVSLMGHEAA